MSDLEIKPKRTLAGKKREAFLDYLREGVPFPSACALIDFTPGEVKELAEGGGKAKSLSTAISKAQAECERRIIAKVMASGNARDALALLQASPAFGHWSPKIKQTPAPSPGKQLLQRLAAMPEQSATRGS